MARSSRYVFQAFVAISVLMGTLGLRKTMPRLLTHPNQPLQVMAYC
jgi:hypothetical protein